LRVFPDEADAVCGPRAEVGDGIVGAVADVYLERGVVVLGHVIHRALERAEIAEAVSGATSRRVRFFGIRGRAW